MIFQINTAATSCNGDNWRKIKINWHEIMNEYILNIYGTVYCVTTKISTKIKVTVF